MNIKEAYQHNRNVEWKQAYDIALLSFLNDGKTFAEASELADERMMQVNWILAKG